MKESGLRPARKACDKRLEPRTQFVQARGDGLGPLLRRLGALRGRSFVAGLSLLSAIVRAAMITRR